MAARLLALTTALIALLALACGGAGDSNEPEPTTTPEFANFSATLERTVCFGACPDYSVTVRGDGSVAYNGRSYVAVTGEQTATVSIDAVRRLIQKIEDIQYFSLADDYPCFATDLPTYVTSVSLNGREKTVNDCGGGGGLSDAPPELNELEDLIDEVSGSAQWVGDNALP